MERAPSNESTAAIAPLKLLEQSIPNAPKWGMAMRARLNMAEYQQVEYRIGKDGTILETVINATGSGCTEITTSFESALGTVAARSLLPEYNEVNEHFTTESQQAIQPG